ncbi:g4791 [Coccomyxa viridis]|uniref:G4791 protein n=1 Tax=Coccomyxa viridis TaxID=1274662 RepID=A0ABP1FR61_9CHLO
MRRRLDVFQKEPPPADNPLVGRLDVVCTPHLGASTRKVQEGVALEIAEAVMAALSGELAATAVNSRMVSAEVPAEQPFVALAQGLGTAAVQLVGNHGFTDVHLTYNTNCGGDSLCIWDSQGHFLAPVELAQHTKLSEAETLTRQIPSSHLMPADYTFEIHHAC